MAYWLWPDQWYLDLGVLLLAVLLDFALPEPPAALHPVVWMGKLISLLESLSPTSGTIGPLLAGIGIALVVPIIFGALAWAAVFGLHQLGQVAYLVGGAILLKTAFAVKGLGQAAQVTGNALEAHDLGEARHSVRSLVSRDAATLTEPLIAAAAIESVAENSTDSYIGPWIAFALLGVPGAFAYRAVNTLDSMLGYHGRYEFLGKASARLDDLVNFLPARITALLMLACGTLMGMSLRQGWNTMWRDHGMTESPNAGWTMSAAAGLLGVVLEKRGHYRLGDGFPEPVPSDLRRAIRMMYLVAALGVLLAAALLMARQALVS